MAVAFDFVALEKLPNADEPTPEADAELPTAVAFRAPAFAKLPTAVPKSDRALARVPKAAASSPSAMDPIPTAVEIHALPSSPMKLFAEAFSPIAIAPSTDFAL